MGMRVGQFNLEDKTFPHSISISGAELVKGKQLAKDRFQSFSQLMRILLQQELTKEAAKGERTA